MKVRLSVNINKIATIRNARGGNVPNVLEAAINCERFGAQGITVHPRPDERHIRYQDVRDIKPVVKTEFNIEGYPTKGFLDLVLEVKPNQVTLVPDPPEVLTSNAGWDTIKNESFLKEIISEFQKYNIRTSIFIETNPEMIKHAVKSGTDRIELYTESYAKNYPVDEARAINIPGLLEVSIGHALISDALYFGLENSIQLYLRQLKD
jgi:pyridoxine 5-phosphate synthase